MAVVLMAWELGSGMGHLDRMRLIADALRDRGHHVVFALRDLARAQARIGSGYEWLQAPVWLPPMRHPPNLPRYPAVMAAAGWMDDSGLAGLVHAWQGLVRAVRPAALLADHAPTALLATRHAPLARFCFGNAFERPPLRDGRFPPLTWWAPSEGPDDEPALLAATNRGLALAGAPPLRALEDIFAGVRGGVLSLPELTHYPDDPLRSTAPADPARTPGAGAEAGSAPDAAAAAAAATPDANGRPLLGPMYAGDRGAAPQWPQAAGPRVFAYLAAETEAMVSTLDALRLLGWPAVVHAKGVDVAAASRRGGPSVHVEPRPLAIDATVRQAALVVSHGSIGTVTAAALAGVPQIALPRHVEQQMVSRRVADGGLGLMLTGLDGSATAAAALAEAMRRVQADAGCAQRVRDLARRHAGATPQRAAALAADQVHRVLMQGSGAG